MTPSPNPDTEAEILRLLEEQPRDGIERLLRTNGDHVLGFLSRRLRLGRAQTELMYDAMIDAAYALAKSIHSFDPNKGTLCQYFCVIARNEAFRRLREERERAARESTMFNLDGILGRIALEGAPLRDPRLTRDFAAFVASLSTTEREILFADMAEGQSANAREVAARAGVKEGSIYTLRRRLRTKLKGWWQAREGGES